MSLTNTSKGVGGAHTVRNAVSVLSGNPLIRTARLAQNPRGVWEIRWTEPQGHGLGGRSKTQSTRQTDRAKAQAFLDMWLKAAAVSEEDTDMRRTIEELCALYGEAKPRQCRPLRPVVKVLGKFTVQDISKHTLMEDYRKLRGRGLKDGSLRRELGALIAALNWCKRRGLFEEPVPLIDLPPDSEPRVTYLTKAQAQEVWDKARAWSETYKRRDIGRRVWLFTALALETAARRGALSELTWDRVNFELRTIDTYNPKFPRNKKQRPTVPISDRLLPVLQEAFGWAWKDDTGRPIGRVLGADGSRIGFAFAKFAHAIGMPWLTPHVFRHTWASHAAIDGVPLFHIAKMLGDSMETVERNYAKLAPSDLMSVVNRGRR